MRRNSALLALALFFVAILALAPCAQAYYEFNGQADNQRDDLGYYYVITGGKFPTGNIPNGDNASGGTFRFLSDDPDWGYPIDTWNKDDWFPQNTGLALTLMNGSATVYDNNGIEDASGVSFYDYTNSPCDNNWPGLYRGYSMPNNYDWIYATYFKLEEETTFDTIIGYFDPTSGFDPFSPYFGYRMNIWSAVQDNPTGNPNSYMPAVASFTGDIFSTDSTLGMFEVSDTGVNRVFPTCLNRPPDAIWRSVFSLRTPLTLPAGVYFFSNDAALLQNIIIGECNTGVNLFPSDLSRSLQDCENGVKNHGQYLKCVSKVLVDAVKAGVITGGQKGAIESCAAQSNIGKK